MTYNIGDRVKHKSGGTPMIVKETRDDGVVCRWHDKGRFREELFLESELEINEVIIKLLAAIK
jgi:uncharacterized protein YodC (DUF2158 family)